MQKRFVTIGIVVFSFFLGAVGANEPTLSYKDVGITMRKMFAYHVENKSFSPQIVRRSSKIYLGQFDPNRVYLLKEEAKGFLELKDQWIQRVVEEYHRDQFSYYGDLNGVIQKAILRNRVFRKRAKERLIKHFTMDLTSVGETRSYDYAKTEEELEQRIYVRLLKEVQFTLKRRKISNVDPDLVERVIEHRDKKRIQFEKGYLHSRGSLKEHALSLHILKALAKSLDAHTSYYSPKEAYEIRTSLKKEFLGVGVVLREDFDGIFIAGLIDGGPAQKSDQIVVGDILVAINHQGIEEITFEELLEEMKGRAGEQLTLGVKKGEGRVVHVDLIREKVIMHAERVMVSFEPYGEGIIGKVTLPAFYDNGGKISADKDLRKALRTLKKQGKLVGLVLDLRENSGGFLSQAVKVSGMFINGGLIVISKYSDDEVSYVRGIDGRQYYDGPFLILTSKASASAAEIVAQALQDYGVALVIGDERSYGKGSMQYQTLTDQRAKVFFKVTVGRYYTASGRSPQIKGVKADIVVPTLFFPYHIGERYLEFPLANDHLSGEVFHSLMYIKKGPHKGLPQLVVPYLQPRETKWRQMLQKLTEKSRNRLASNQNFQLFLKQGKRYRAKGGGGHSGALLTQGPGVEDLQVKEAVEIIKDMLVIQKDSEQTVGMTFSKQGG